jgi:hypothetical protein
VPTPVTVVRTIEHNNDSLRLRLLLRGKCMISEKSTTEMHSIKTYNPACHTVVNCLFTLILPKTQKIVAVLFSSAVAVTQLWGKYEHTA